MIVSEVRETSRKPDEIYGLIERMLEGGKYLELFALSLKDRGRRYECKEGTEFLCLIIDCAERDVSNAAQKGERYDAR